MGGWVGRGLGGGGGFHCCVPNSINASPGHLLLVVLRVCVCACVCVSVCVRACLRVGAYVDEYVRAPVRAQVCVSVGGLV